MRKAAENSLPGLKGGAEIISTWYTFGMLLTSSGHFMLASSGETISPKVKGDLILFKKQQTKKTEPMELPNP